MVYKNHRDIYLQVLKGEIIVQRGKDLSQKVAFQIVRERVRHELRNAADDPDLPELFEFLISQGVGTNTYVDDLLEFGACFVDGKKRQLRFTAFAVANKINERAPWTKVAVMKRAFRKKPTNGFCPSPEPLWGECEWDRLRKLEITLGEELATHEFIKANGRYPTYSELHGPSDWKKELREHHGGCLLYTSPSPRDQRGSGVAGWG